MSLEKEILSELQRIRQLLASDQISESEALDKRLLELSRRKQLIYKVLPTISLASAHTNTEIAEQGTFIYVQTLTSGGNASIRLNEVNADLLVLASGMKIKAPFYRIFLTNTAIADKSLILWIGKLNFEVK